MSEVQFKPAWWLRNSHFQTLWPTLCRKEIKNLHLERERIELPDGDFIDIDWAGPCQKDSPIVMILHGLEGSIKSPYAKGMLLALHAQGWRGAFMNFRGCSGEHNRLVRGYHSGDTADVSFIVNSIKLREPSIPIAAIGFSLGGNVLVKWLGETGLANPLTAAVAISVPFEVQKVVKRMNTGFSRIYQWHLLNCLREKIKTKFQNSESVPFSVAEITKIKTLREFDNKVTAPLHGFLNAEDYYNKSSCRAYIKNIRKPTLLLQAKDDPFLVEDLLPTARELPEFVKFELSEKGGHVGFVSGKIPWRPEYWLEKRVPLFLKNYF